MRTSIRRGLLLALAAVLIIFIVWSIFGKNPREVGKKDRSAKETDVLSRDSQESLSSLEKKLELQQKQGESGEDGAVSRSAAVRFLPALFVGDEAARGFTLSGVIYPINVFAVNKATPSRMAREIDAIKALDPLYIFLAFRMVGIADAVLTPDAMQEQYKELVEGLQESMPDAKICIVSLQPVSEKKAKEQYIYSNTSQYNEKLAALAEQLQLPYVDLTGIVSADSFESDGMTMSPDYYSAAADELAKGAGL